MNIQLISVGKIREKYLKAGIAEFEKRLQPYCKLTMTELTDEQEPEQLSEKELQRVKDKEGERILQRIKEGSHVIALDVKGTSWTSEQLTEEMQKLSYAGKDQIVFIIGGSNGLSEAVLKRANQKLSFSNMTFTHQIMKLTLVEEVYRGYKIQREKPYHK